MCGYWTYIGTKSVKMKFTWRPTDVNDARIVGYLPRKDDNSKWNCSKRKKFIAVNNDDKVVGDLK